MSKIILGIVLIICLVSCATNTRETLAPDTEKQVVIVNPAETTRRLEKERSEIVAFLSEKSSKIVSEKISTPPVSDVPEIPTTQTSEITIPESVSIEKTDALEKALKPVESEIITETIEPIEEINTVVAEDTTNAIVDVMDAVIEAVREEIPTAQNETELEVVHSYSELFLGLLNSESFYSTLHKISNNIKNRMQEPS